MVEYFAIKNQAKIKKLNCTCRIVAVGLSPTLDNRKTVFKTGEGSLFEPACVLVVGDLLSEASVSLPWGVPPEG